MFVNLGNTFRYILTHPLNRHHKLAAIRRYLAWQISAKVLPLESVMPFVNGSQLLVAPSMTGATGNLYCGLHEFEEMAFVLHVLRPGDLFLDVGANVGAYSVLAATRGANVIAYEPSTDTFGTLCKNLRLNHFGSQVLAKNYAVGDQDGMVSFSRHLDSINHVVVGDGTDGTESVSQTTLDSEPLECDGRIVLKIDVEGYELPVIRGAQATFEDDRVLAAILELNGSDERYGFERDELVHCMESHGFNGFQYEPFQRNLCPVEDLSNVCGNVIFVRQVDVARSLAKESPKFSVHGHSL